MGVKELPVREEVLESIDPAPKLGKILQVFEGREHEDTNTKILSDPREFFKRTFITRNMIELFEKVLDGFEGKGKRVFALHSFYGGGKTHMILALLHAFRDPDALLDREVVKDLDNKTRARLEEVVKRIKGIKVKVVPFAGEISEFSGSPLNPTSVGSHSYRTLWGYLAHKLGKFEEYAEADRTLTAPQQDAIKKMFKGERVLFIFDEVFDYLINFVGGEYRSYAMTVINFMEYFISAVSESSSVAVIALPVDTSGQMDYRYQALSEGELDKLNRSLWNALKNHAEFIEPISTQGAEVLNVLRKRLFKEIKSDVRDKAIQKLKEKVENYIVYFNSKEFVDIARETYPFSPDYIRVLQELIMRTKLQKTRDALEISMRVLKEILKSKVDPDFIMPFHINLIWFSKAFMDQSEYKLIYEKYVESYESEDFGELPKYILRVIFISTFHYDSLVPNEMFPTEKDIVRMVFEPATFSVNNLEVKDILNAIDEIRANRKIIYLNEKDGRFWFYKLPNIREYINKRARGLFENGDVRIYDKIEEFIRYGLMGSLEDYAMAKTPSTRRKRGKQPQQQHVFDETLVIKDFGEYPADDRKLKLAVILRPDLVSGVSDILNSFKESQRSYRNTLVILSPAEFSDEYGYYSVESWPKEYKELMESAAGLIAANEISNEVELYYDKFGKDAVDLQKSIVENEIKMYKAELALRIPRSFIYVIYIDGENVVCKKIVRTQYSLPDAVQGLLRDEGKLVDQLDFEYFSFLLKKEVGFDLEESDSMRTVQQIIDWFLQNPKFPIVKEETVRNTIAIGVKTLRIGLLRKRGDEVEVYFKPICDSKPALDVGIEEGNVPSKIYDDDGVLPRKRAIEEQFKLLKSKQTENAYPTHIERVYYVVYTDKGEYTLDQLETLQDWKDTFLYGKVVGKVEKVDKDLILDIYPTSVQKVKPGGKAKFTIQVRPANLKFDALNIRVRRKGGSLVLEETLQPEETGTGLIYRKEFEVEPEESIEEFEVEVVTVGEQEKSKKGTIKVLIEEEEESITTREVGMEHLGYYLLSIDEIADFDVVNVLKESIVPLVDSGRVRGKVHGKIKATYAGGKLELTIEDMDLEVGIPAAVELANYGDEKSVNRFRVEFEDTLLDEILIRKLGDLRNRATFTLMRGEE